MSIKKLTISIFLLGIIFIPSTVHAVAFGALISSPKYECENGGYMVKANGWIYSAKSSFLLIFGPGSKAYLFGPPKWPGQWAVGTAKPSLCKIGNTFHFGYLIDSAPGVGTSLR